MKSLVLPKIDAVLKQEGQISNIRQIIKAEFTEVLSKDILPRLETQIGEMLKSMQEVNLKVCAEL
jgi:hypothetical protein